MSAIKIALISLVLAACATTVDPPNAVTLEDHGAVTATTTTTSTTLTPPAGEGGQITTGTFTFSIFEAGTVTFTVSESDVVLDSVDTAPGWSYELEEEIEQGELEIDLTNGSVDIDFEVELSAGTMEVELDRETSTRDGQHSFPAWKAGVVTVAVSGTNVSLVSVQAEEDWTYEVDQAEAADGEVELDFINPAIFTKVEFEAQVDDEEREFEVEIEITIGPGFDAPDDDLDDDDDD